MNKLKNISTEDIWQELVNRHKDGECIQQAMPSYIDDLAHAVYVPDIWDSVDKEYIKENFDTEEIWDILDDKRIDGECIARTMPDSIREAGREYFYEEFNSDIEDFDTEDLLHELFKYRDVDLDEIMEYLDIDPEKETIAKLFNCSTYAEFEYVNNKIAEIKEALINFTYMKTA